MSNSIDTALLRILKDREKFEKLYGILPMFALDDKTRVILQDFEIYFSEFPEHTRIDTEAFPTWFFGFRHKTLSKDQQDVYRKLFTSIQVNADAQTESGIVQRILELDYATRCANIIQKYNDGAEINVLAALEEASETFKAQVSRKIKVPWINTPIEELLDREENNTGLQWRLDVLNQHMRPLRPGDFGVVAARPDVGKTTFFTDNITHMAAQFNTVYPGEDRVVLWFNNEGLGERIIPRLYQSALNCTLSELLKKRAAGTLVNEYRAAIGGSLDRIRILDIHDMWNYEVKEIIEQVRPGLIIFDMIDNIKFGGLNGPARTDQVLESMYQWARVLGVRFDCPVLATSQISNEGDGMQFPTLGMLKDSKTGKQGACDFQLMIGYMNDPCMQHSRFLGLPKNKLQREGASKDPRAEVLFDANRGRYVQPVQA